MLRGGCRKRSCVAAALFVALFCLLGGCTVARPAGRPQSDRDTAASLAPWDSPNLVLPERLDQGYTLVLPGVGGDSTLDHGIILGLKDADVRSAVELHNWTTGSRQPIDDLRSLEHNRAEAQKIARKILLYQERYPGRPVHLVGYSGGGGVAVLALEALPPGHRVTSAILLAPTLAFDYDLQRALSRTEQGIRNFYSPLDAPILGLLTLAIGTTDGRHTLAAGVVGFQAPQSLDAAQRQAYQARLAQQEYQIDMLWDGHGGGHFGWSSRTFVARHIAPLVDHVPAAPPQVAARDVERVF